MNKDFTGFPVRTSFTPIPDGLFSHLLQQIEDMAELKVTLYLFWLLHHKRGYPRFATHSELLSDRPLQTALNGLGKTTSEALLRGLDLALSRGTVLRLSIEREGKTQHLYFINTESGRRELAKIKSGDIPVEGKIFWEKPEAVVAEQPNIYALYEQNIGMLTPLVVEELKEAEKLYSVQWIEEAFKEAVSLNKRNWRYIARILERWAAEGKSDGKPGRYSKADNQAKEYLTGKYGHIIRH